MSDGKLELKKLWVLMVTAFVDMIGFALIVPLLPFYATEFGADAFTVGILMGIFAVGQMIASPLWGRLSDRVGRKRVMIWSQAISAFAFALFAAADSVVLLLACRFLQGVGAGSLGAVNAFVSDAVRPEERAKALGWITACTSAGVMVGPAIGSLTVGFGRWVPGLIAAGFCAVNIVFTTIWLTDARRPTAPASGRPVVKIGGQLKDVLLHPEVTVNGLIWIYTAGMMAFMSMTGIMALYLGDEFDVTAKTIGFFYVAVGFVSLVMRGLILGKMVHRFGEVRTLRVGAVTLGLGLVGIALAPSKLLFALLMLLVPSGTALLFPCVSSLVTRYADPEQVGQTVGVQQAFGGVSRLLAPIWAGAVYQELGKQEPFIIGGILVFVTAALSLRLRPGEAPGKPMTTRGPAVMEPAEMSEETHEDRIR